MNLTALVLVVLTLGLLVPDAARGADAGALKPTRLRCEFRVDPLGIDAAAPRLDWLLEPADPKARRLVQGAYQVLVASSPERLAEDHGDLWDSGKIASDRTNGVPYGGKPLASDQPAWWKVRVWDGAGAASPWSEPAQWRTGVLRAEDWQAKWITPPGDLGRAANTTALLRNEFTAKPGLRRATVNVCGLGQYEMHVNGANLTADVLTPGWTAYEKTCLYDTYDVTPLVREGPNAVGLLLGNGMYRVAKGGRYAKFERTIGPLQAIARIRLEYQDGSVEIVGTDDRWRAGTSPLTFSSIFGGENWDARLEQPGWDQPGFEARDWQPAVVSPGPGGALRGTNRSAPPVRTFQTHAGKPVQQPKPNVTVYDLGQAASHMNRFTVRGPAGAVVRVTPSELLNPDGTVFRNNYNGKAWYEYTLAGRESEAFTSRFFYSGHRYLQVECVPPPDGGAVPELTSIEGIVVHSSVARTGQFSCSNELFNRIYAMVQWAELSNMMSVISDCPHRERLGWLEQVHLHGPSFRYSYDMSPFIGKIIDDMAEGQTEQGLVPTQVPEYTSFPPRWRDAIEWGSSAVLLPWQEYAWTGDLDALRRSYPMMKRYVDYLTSKAKDGIAARGLGDWSGRWASKETPHELISTALYFQDISVLAKAARLLGDEREAGAWEKLALDVQAAFNATFFNADTNQYATGSQGAHGMALDIGLVHPKHREAVLANLIADIEHRDYAMTVGEVCLPYLLRALADAGRSDVIFKMHNQDRHPGYGYQLKQGATALCETWDAHRDNSQIQFMLGHIMEWFYGDLAGIRPDASAPGYRKFTIRPAVVADLTEVKCAYESPRGRIVSEWKRDGDRFTLHVVVPPNTAANVRIPATSPDGVTEGGKHVAAGGITFSNQGKGFVEYEVGSGDYTFESKLP